MLMGEKLIGRIEAAADRKTSALVVRHIWLEDGVRGTKKLTDSIGVTVRRLARFNGCSNVVWQN